MATIATHPLAQIVDMAEFRLRRTARTRAALRVKQRFLWSWPTTGQLVAAEFPVPAANPASLNIRTR